MMSVTIRRPTPLDLTEERLQIGDTTQAVAKMGKAWDELTKFSQQLNDMADDVEKAAKRAIAVGFQKVADELPSNDVGIIWSERYHCLMSWQVFKNPADNSIIFEGYASSNIGRIVPDTQPIPRAGHIKSGQIINKSDYPALEAWAIHHGLLKPVNEWQTDTLFWGDDGDDLQSPLLENFIRFSGENATFADKQNATKVFEHGFGNHDGVTRATQNMYWYAGEENLHYGENFTEYRDNNSVFDYGYSSASTGNTDDLSHHVSYETRPANAAFLASIVAY